MSNTQANTTYTLSCGAGFSTAAGTQCNGAIQLSISAGSDFADADLFEFQQALVGAFPAAWGVGIGDISAMKEDEEVTTYTTHATSTPPSFS